MGYGVQGPWKAGVLTPYTGLSLGEQGNHTWRAAGPGGRSLLTSHPDSKRVGAQGGNNDTDSSLMLRALSSLLRKARK